MHTFPQYYPILAGFGGLVLEALVLLEIGDIWNGDGMQAMSCIIL